MHLPFIYNDKIDVPQGFKGHKPTSIISISLNGRGVIQVIQKDQGFTENDFWTIKNLSEQIGQILEQVDEQEFLAKMALT